MSNVIPFQQQQGMPALFQELFGSTGLGDDLSANVGASYPYLSIKGKSFTVVDGGVGELITNADVSPNPQPGTEGMPAQYISVVLLKSARELSKTFYLNGYENDAHDRPDCASFNGVVPDPGVPAPQSQACAGCWANQWGSRPNTNEGQESKGKACQDARRVAVAIIDDLGSPMLLRVPPVTLKGLAEYGQTLAKKGVPFQAVVTMVYFDPAVAYPKLMFKAARFVTPQEAEQVMSLIGNPAKGIAPDLILDQICAIQNIAPQPAAQVQPKPQQPGAAAKNVAPAQPQGGVPGGMFDDAQQTAQQTPQQPQQSAPPPAEPPKRTRSRKPAAAAAPDADQGNGTLPEGAAHEGVTVMNGNVAQGVDALLGGLPDVPGI